MSNPYETKAWLTSIADAISADDQQATGSAIVKAIDAVVEHGGTALLAFHRNARPDVLHHTLEPAGRKHYLERYLEGPYLLDPLYELALKSRRPTLCRFRDARPDRFRSSEYYRQYCERTHLFDEMDYVVPVHPDTSLVLVVGQRDRMFHKAEVERLQQIESIVLAAIGKLWRLRETGRRNKSAENVHRRLTECFDNFGRNELTRREREISQLLLRGHSSKSVARVLRIAPGTVMVHKRNLFAKLGISSQYELFSRFIDNLQNS